MKSLFNIQTLLTAIFLMAYFTIMDIVGLADRIELRFFNAIIVGAMLFIFMNKHAHTGDDFGLKYGRGMGRGLLFTVGSTILYTAFFLLYLALTGGDLLTSLQSQGVLPGYFNSWHLAFIIIFEGAVSGAILTFIFMQYFKYDFKRKVGHTM